MFCLSVRRFIYLTIRLPVCLPLSAHSIVFPRSCHSCLTHIHTNIQSLLFVRAVKTWFTRQARLSLLNMKCKRSNQIFLTFKMSGVVPPCLGLFEAML